jgi:hypothetical protein
MLKSYLEGGMK